jgi:hypothetical protein
MQIVKALFLAANPAGTTRLAVDEEMRAIEQKVRASDHPDVLVFQSNWAVRPDDLLQLLNQHRPQIVHFSGHGSHTGLCLTGNDGQVKLVTTPALEALFAALKDNIRLVVLNACYSQEQAWAFVKTIDGVVGMKESIHDDAATVFASSFYRAIGFGRSVQEAFDQGRAALLLEHIPEEDIPVLLVKNGMDPRQMFLIGDTTEPFVDLSHSTVSGGLQQGPIWNVPFARNPVFTGRENLVKHLHTHLQSMTAAALSQPQAISGLGGIGKTQLALEYAYRFRSAYQAVLWVRAETVETLNASYVEIARRLQLPQQDVQEQEVIVQAVRDWLRVTTGWLLIMDNADDLTLVQPFLPTEYPGHLVLTTRTQITGTIAQRFEVDVLEANVGALLLLRRAGLLASGALLEAASSFDRVLASTLSAELGGLPLALDQAGAYIEETGCSLSDYRQTYQAQQAKLLAHQGRVRNAYPASVATTWSLSLARIEATSPTAVELLQACAFLAPDAILRNCLSRCSRHLCFQCPLHTNDEDGVAGSLHSLLPTKRQ